MRSTYQKLAAATLAVMIGATTAHAQAGFGIAGGLTMPSGDAKDAVKNGYNGMVMFGVSAPMLPFAVRIDGVYHSLGTKGIDGKATVLGGQVNAILKVPGMILVSPYVSAGVGMYRTKIKFDSDAANTLCGSACDSETKVGFNGGVGVNFGLAGMHTFLEARYLQIQTSDGSTKLIPITVGVMFGGG